MGVGVGVAPGVGLGVGDAVGPAVSDARARVPQRRSDPIVTLSWPARVSVRNRLVRVRLRVRPRLTVPVIEDVTEGSTTTRARRLEHVPV